MSTLCAWFLSASMVYANDAAVETSAGGIVLRNENRIWMSKERLYIGKKFSHEEKSNLPLSENTYSVVVEYSFVNTSAVDVTTQVAFPLPEISYPWEDLIQDRKIHNFSVEVDGQTRPFSTEVKAKVGDRDVTPLLIADGIDVERFGFYDHDPIGQDRYQIRNLTKPTIARLMSEGIIGEDREPLWSVHITHYWTQLFPARREVKIRHSYSAIPGFSYAYDVDGYLSFLKDGCFDNGLRDALKKAQVRKRKGGSDGMVMADWVSYILTTANTWAGPIADFELIVERPKGQFLSFCWNGETEKIGPNSFRSRAKNFVPKNELKVYFFSVR